MHVSSAVATLRLVAGRRARCLAALLAFAFASVGAAAPPAAPSSTAHGARDGSIPAWTISAPAPAGWTADCCLYAKAIGVNAVLYRGQWSGKPQRVMVLNVWPRKLPTLAAEVAADRARYLQLDPAGKTTSFAVRHRAMRCTTSVYQGSDHVDDVLVFCDPGPAAGVRLSWSMTLDAGDPAQRALLGDFMRVVVGTRYAAVR
jgi:hypothetical protein